MTKSEALNVWRILQDMGPVNPLDRMEALPYPCPKGSRFGTDRIRIEGSHGFVNAVLSQLTDLIEGENEETSLSISRVRIAELNNKAPYKRELPMTGEDAEVCYISLRERGGKQPRKPL